MSEANLRDFALPARLRDADDPAKIAAVVATEEATGSTKKGLLSRIVGFVDLLSRIGEVQASPTAYTLLDRLKTIAAALAGTLTVQGANSTTATATITGGDATGLSGAVDCGSARLALIIMPAGWTAADLTFKESVDNSTFVDKYDAYGVEYTVVCAASRAIVINLPDFLGARYLKFRSGTSGTPVTQSGNRVLTLVLVP
ncbi:hypothetical protein [Reyranella sp.]|uniref:hypothetical protein n=1 Tax=Reyranella sp. TaxID=1929291 RepID=UPI003C7EC35A